MLDLGRSGQDHILFSHRPARRPWDDSQSTRSHLNIASEATQPAGGATCMQIRSSAKELSQQSFCGCCTLQMTRVYAALKRRCWGVQPDNMCCNCSLIFFDNLTYWPATRPCHGFEGQIQKALGPSWKKEPSADRQTWSGPGFWYRVSTCIPRVPPWGRAGC